MVVMQTGPCTPYSVVSTKETTQMRAGHHLWETQKSIPHTPMVQAARRQATPPGMSSSQDRLHLGHVCLRGLKVPFRVLKGTAGSAVWVCATHCPPPSYALDCPHREHETCLEAGEQCEWQITPSQPSQCLAQPISYWYLVFVLRNRSKPGLDFL